MGEGLRCCPVACGQKMGPGTPRTPLTIALESSQLAIQGDQVFGQLLDTQEHFGIIWDTQMSSGDSAEGPA